MVKDQSKKTTPASAEHKIKEAARMVFHDKGYAATRTRDIAKAAGINLALLNYYFRSKEKLYEIIMMETMQNFFKSVLGVFYNDQTSLSEKIQIIVCSYIDLLTENPNMPLFLLNELKANPQGLIEKMGVKNKLMKSVFIKQFKKAVKDGKITAVHPVHFIVNILSLTVFPFAAAPMLKAVGGLSQTGFNKLMQERKQLIPKWVNVSLKAK